MKILLSLSVLGLLGCATGHPLGEKEEAWYLDQRWVLGFTWTDIYFCKANKTERGAVPQCFEAEKMTIKAK